MKHFDNTAVICVFLCLWFRVNVKCPPLLEDELLVSIGKKYNKSPAQVALRFNAQRGVVVIPKSFNPGRIKHNFQVGLPKCILWHILYILYMVNAFVYKTSCVGKFLFIQYSLISLNYFPDFWFFTHWGGNESHWSIEQKYSLCGAADVSKALIETKWNLILYLIFMQMCRLQFAL